MKNLDEELKEIFNQKLISAENLEKYPVFFKALTAYYHEILENPISNTDRDNLEMIDTIYREIQSQIIALFGQSRSHDMESETEKVIISCANQITFDFIAQDYRKKYSSLSISSPPAHTDQDLCALIAMMIQDAHMKKKSFFFNTLILKDYFKYIRIKNRDSVFFAWAEYLHVVYGDLADAEKTELIGMLCSSLKAEERQYRMQVLISNEKYKYFIPHLFENHHTEWWGQEIQSYFETNYLDLWNKAQQYNQKLSDICNEVTALQAYCTSWVYFSEKNWSTGFGGKLEVTYKRDHQISFEDIFPSHDPSVSRRRIAEWLTLCAPVLNTEAIVIGGAELFFPLHAAPIAAFFSSPIWANASWLFLAYEGASAIYAQGARISYYLHKLKNGSETSPYDQLHESFKGFFKKHLYNCVCHSTNECAYTAYSELFMQHYLKLSENPKSGILLMDFQKYHNDNPDKLTQKDDLIFTNLHNKVLSFRTDYPRKISDLEQAIGNQIDQYDHKTLLKPSGR